MALSLREDLQLDRFWAARHPASRKGTRWDQELFVLVAYRLLAPGSEWRLLVYGHATGVFSSRKLDRPTYDSVAFRFIAANDHPDHDTIATFRRRFLKDIEKLFVEVLQVAREMGVLKMGTIGLDGTKIHANASRHSALSYEHAGNPRVEEPGGRNN